MNSLGEFLAPLMPTGLPGLQWQAWMNGELVTLDLIECQEGFFLQVQVWCGLTLMQNMGVAAPLITGTLHFDMDAICPGHDLHPWREHPLLITGAQCNLP